MRKVEEGGSIEAVHHRDHCLLPITLPAGQRGDLLSGGQRLTLGCPLPHSTRGAIPQEAFTSEVRVGEMGWDTGAWALCTGPPEASQ